MLLDFIYQIKLLKKLIIIGASGLLGSNWAKYALGKYNVYLGLNKRKISIDGTKSIFLNIFNEDELKKKLEKINPSIVINCSGLTNVELCEKNEKEAYKLNSLIPGVLSKICNDLNYKFIQISTDHIFCGTKKYRKETEFPEPKNIYAKSKLLGEQKALENNKNSLVIRTNFYGKGPAYRPSFSDFIVNNLINGHQINLFNDMFYTPIHINELLNNVHSLLNINSSGIFNVVSDHRISKYDFGILIAKKLNLDVDLIKMAKLSERKDLTVRPFDLSLTNEKLKKHLNLSLISLHNDIELLNKLKI